MTYQEQKMQILELFMAKTANRYGGFEGIDAEDQEIINEASLALDELVQKMVIGEDENARGRVEPNSTRIRHQNHLRASQRLVIEEGRK